MDDRTGQSQPDQAVDAAQHATQAAYAVMSAAKAGSSAAGAAAGTAVGGPLGTVIGTIVTSKTFWKIIGGIAAMAVLWLFVIVNFIGIILNYLGFADAGAFARAAQSAEISGLQTRIEEILEIKEYEKGILALIEAERDRQLEEIHADKEDKFKDHEIKVIDEYETRLKGSLVPYLTALLAEIWDTGVVRSFIGYADGFVLGMDTDLASPYDAYFEEAAQAYGVPAALLKAVGKVESDYNPNAVSGSGAMGIMQLMPATAASLGVSDPFDPEQNIMGGAKYIAGNLEQFKFCENGLELAIAAYNAGAGAVIRAGYQIPSYSGVKEYVEKVLGYISILEDGTGSGGPAGTGQEAEEGLESSYSRLEAAVAENVGTFFSWSVTGEEETEKTVTKYFLITADGKEDIEKTTYKTLKGAGENVGKEKITEPVKSVEYTLALMLDSQVPSTESGYEYRYVMDRSRFELVLKMLHLLQDGASVLKGALFTEFSWPDLVTGGGSEDAYYGNIDVTGDIIAYDTVAGCVKEVVYFNQGEEPWGSMKYGSGTIGSAGCGPTTLAIVISTLTGQNVTPQMTCAYAMDNGEYVSGSGTSHSFPSNAATHWGLSVERAGKDRMDYVIQSLKKGKLVVMICRENTITGSGNGHYIVLTGVTKEGHITIADCGSRERTGKVYSVETIKSYGRDLSDGAFWIISKPNTPPQAAGIWPSRHSPNASKLALGSLLAGIKGGNIRHVREGKG